MGHAVKWEPDFLAGFRVRGARHVPVDHQALKRARAAWGKRDSRAFNAMFLGDSLLEGYGPTTFERRPLQHLRRILQQFEPFSGGIGYLPVRGGTGMDTQWTFAGTHDTNEYGFGLGRRSTWMNSSDDRSNLTFFGDRIWIFFTAGTGTNDAVITIDGGAPVTINTFAQAARGGWVWDSGPLTRNTHTLVISTILSGGPYNVILDGAMVFDGEGSAPPSPLYQIGTTNASPNVTGTGFTAAMTGKKIFGTYIPAGATFTYVSGTTGTISANATGTGTKTCQVVGVNPAAGKGVRIWDGSHAGYQASAFGDTSAGARYWSEALTEVTPDIVFIDFMHNDEAGGGLSIAQYKVYLKGIIDNMDLVLTATQRPSIVMCPPYVTSGNTDSSWLPWRLAMEQVAEENGYAVLDFYNVLGDVHDGSNDMIGVTSDNVHFSDAGARLFAGMAADLIMPGTDVVAKPKTRITSIVSSATPSINTDTTDVFKITNLAANISSFGATGSNQKEGDEILISFYTQGAQYTIAWSSAFESSMQALPASNYGLTRMDVKFMWNPVSSKWRCVGVT